MTEFEYDSYIKKNIAHSAARRKGGSKSRKCPLSTDNMSRKQWEERCGKIVSYQIGRPMVWADFNKLPRDLKEEYMNSLIQKYSANARNMADMFGVSVATVFRVVKKENLNVEFLKGRHPSGNKQEQFQKFLAGENEFEEIAEEVSTIEKTEDSIIDTEALACENPKSVEKHVTCAHLDSFSMNFSGAIDVDMIANSLRYILSSGSTAKIQIICEIE